MLADRATAEGGTVPAALTAGVLGLVARRARAAARLGASFRSLLGAVL